jgi:hypothetical protein
MARFHGTLPWSDRVRRTDRVEPYEVDLWLDRLHAGGLPLSLAPQPNSMLEPCRVFQHAHVVTLDQGVCRLLMTDEFSDKVCQDSVEPSVPGVPATGIRRRAPARS